MSARFEAIRAQQISRRAVSWIKGRPLLFGPAYALTLAFLWVGGLDPWRLTAAGVGCLLTLFWWIFSALRAREGEVGERDVYRAALLSSGLYGLLIALTGGLGSPLLPFLLGPVTGLLMLYGRAREAKVSIAWAVLLLLVQLLIPETWTPTPLRAPWGGLLMGFAVLHTLVLLQSSVAIIVDINRETAASLERLRGEIFTGSVRRSQALESLGAKVAHELKNPLAAVKGLVQLLDRSVTEPRSRERLDVVCSEIVRMERIIAEYLSFSRPIETLELSEVQLAVMADEVIAVLEGQARAKRVGFSRQGDASLMADERRLKEALLNLVTNAVDASFEGGRVEILISRREDGADLSVRDYGEGLSAEDLSRLGTPFFSRRKGGTGLGVVLARACVNQHGGELSFESERGQGTTVVAKLPLSP